MQSLYVRRCQCLPSHRHHPGADLFLTAGQACPLQPDVCSKPFRKTMDELQDSIGGAVIGYLIDRAMLTIRLPDLFAYRIQLRLGHVPRVLGAQL